MEKSNYPSSGLNVFIIFWYYIKFITRIQRRLWKIQTHYLCSVRDVFIIFDIMLYK